MALSSSVVRTLGEVSCILRSPMRKLPPYHPSITEAPASKSKDCVRGSPPSLWDKGLAMLKIVTAHLCSDIWRTCGRCTGKTPMRSTADVQPLMKSADDPTFGRCEGERHMPGAPADMTLAAQ